MRHDIGPDLRKETCFDLEADHVRVEREAETVSGRCWGLCLTLI